ncbi:MAG TPA: hypothetical protein VGP08_13680 [Pyrinomonadaceae bacterium]|jgi:hypothetical protein|nr:hypothetical protein [Pyrinomonadaceae bacterium]
MSQPVREKRIRVGDDVETYCGRCKAERSHVIASMSTAAVPAEVICRTCNSQHRFRRPADAAKPKREPRAGVGTTRRTSRTVRETPPLTARAYSTTESFAEGEWIEHKTHGIGKINAVRGGKIDVTFDSGLRTLLHAG